MNSKQLRNSLLLLLTAAIWGSAFVAQSIGADYVGPFTFLALRSILGALVLTPVALAMRKPDTDYKTLVIGGILCGLCLFFASYTQQAGIAYTTTAKAGFITALYVIIVPFISLLTGKRTGIRIIFCAILAVIGMYFLTGMTSLALAKGDTLVLICALIFSLHIMVIDKYSPLVNGVMLSWIQFIVVSILAVFSMLVFEDIDFSAIKFASGSILYAGILSSGVAYTLQIVGQKDLNPTLASIIMCMESVFSAATGYFVLHEVLSPRELLGCALIFTGIIIAQFPDKRSR